MPPPLPPISVSVAPGNATVPQGGIKVFTAMVTNDANHRGVTWSLSGQGCSGAGCGKLTSTTQNPVTYMAPANVPNPATVTLTAASVADNTKSSLTTVTITQLSGSAELQEVPGDVPADSIEIQGLSAGNFNPDYWQQNTLNWVPDVRVPMLAPQTTGPYQNIYAPWPLEQPDGWRLFYGGWDGTDTPNDRVYSATTPDFLSFNNRTPVIDHGAFEHVNNENVQQLPDGSMHMVCTVLQDSNSLDKPAYFSSPDGLTWNGSPAPYSAQLSDVVAVPNDPTYAGYDFNGGNVLLRDNDAWTLYYSVGIYGGIGQVYRATTASPPVFERTGVALSTPHYANDVKKFQAGGKDWYDMALYVERVSTDPNPPTFSYSLSNDGRQFGPEQKLFGGAYPQDQFPVTPAFVTRGNQILGVLYGANPIDLLNPQDQIFARWLQKKVLITDSSDAQHTAQGALGPDRQWFEATGSGLLEGTIIVYAEDGVTPVASGSVNISAGKSYRVLLNGGG